MTRVPATIRDLRAAHAELRAIVDTIDCGSSVDAEDLDWQLVLEQAGLIKIDADGLVTVTAAGRRLAAIQVRP